MRLTDCVKHLDEYLHVGEIPDAPHALNGLQCANAGEITRVGAAVDLCAATIEAAVREHVDLLLVHHGLFWSGLSPLVGPRYTRVTQLMKHNIAVYSAHLPLDCHREIGNNILLARALGVHPAGEFGITYGKPIGVWGTATVPRDVLQRQLTTLLGAAPFVMPFGPAQVQRVGIVTGAGGSMIPEAAELGLDTFITGEGPHHTFFDAEELRLNVFYAGHYATETFGVKALAEHLGSTFQLPWTFLDHPTGL
jgi:dinuclear metal center YbgI/SA1388 family protein